MSYRPSLLMAVALMGCDQQPASDSPFRHFESVAQTTKKWLGVSSPSERLDLASLSRVDELDGRLRRRLDLVQMHGVTQQDLKTNLRKQVGEKRFTERMHVGAVVLFSKSPDRKVVGVAVYSRDGLGWTGKPVDHLRVQLLGEKGFEALVAELK